MMKIAGFYTCSNHCSRPAHGRGRRTDHRNLKISRKQKFFQPTRSQELPTITNCNGVSAGKCAIFARWRTGGTIMLTPSPLWRGQNIHRKDGPMTSRRPQLSENNAKPSSRTPVPPPLGPNPENLTSLYFYVYFWLSLMLETTSEKTVKPIKFSFQKKISTGCGPNWNCKITLF